MDHSTRSADSRSTFEVTAGNGDRLGEYRKPHMIAAITPGTAYGTKNARRKKRLPRSNGESSSRANSSARPSITGTCTTPNSSTRPTEVQNAVFWNTSAYCARPPNTSRA
jgi:hypothetical protein